MGENEENGEIGTESHTPPMNPTKHDKVPPACNHASEMAGYEHRCPRKNASTRLVSTPPPRARARIPILLIPGLPQVILAPASEKLSLGTDSTPGAPARMRNPPRGPRQ